MIWKMPERSPRDGAINVTRTGDNELTVTVIQNDDAQSVVMSDYNAARIFGTLALFLGISLPPKLGKAITLGDAKMGIR